MSMGDTLRVMKLIRIIIGVSIFAAFITACSGLWPKDVQPELIALFAVMEIIVVGKELWKLVGDLRQWLIGEKG